MLPLFDSQCQQKPASRLLCDSVLFNTPVLDSVLVFSITGKAMNKPIHQIFNGTSQLSLVEHALCPIDSRSSLVKNQTFKASYYYYSETEGRQEARAEVLCPLGLSATDELYLWGLLALTLHQPKPEPELVATPHWCLRQLGLINSTSKRGGRQYQQFFQAIRRISAVTYMNDRFYDPIRKEHRRVSFGFLSYSLPTNLQSPRAWHFAWDPIFFKMVQAIAGSLRFDLSVYRSLDPASRRLFLFLCKVLSRREHIKAIRLEHLAVNLLGFSAELDNANMKSKVTKCLRKLCDLNVLSDMEIFKTSPGNFFVRLTRGSYFDQPVEKQVVLCPEDSPLFDSLQTIGFDQRSSARLIRKFPRHVLSEWIDITQAAIETFGPKHFRKSPMAYLVDSVTKAADGHRTPPDWWHDMRRAENRVEELPEESRQFFARVRSEVFGSQIAADSKNDKHGSGLVSVVDILAAKQRDPEP
jgi:hypothetical protein